MKWIALVLLALSLGACSSNNDSPKNNGTCGAGAVLNCAPGFAGKVTNQSEYPNVANAIFGGWQSEKSVSDNGFTFRPTLYFAQDGRFSITMFCDTPKRTLAVTAESRVTSISNAQVTFPAVPKTTFAHDGETCDVQVSAGSVVYVVNGNNMTMTYQATGESSKFIRMPY